MGKAYSEIAAERVSNWLYNNKEYDEINYLKAKLGIEATIINVSKIMIVYSISLMFGLLIPTLITHLSYLSLRRVSMGLHAKSSFVCTVVSVIIFVVIPYLIQGVWIGNELLLIGGLITTILFWLYAPADTEKAPIIGAKRRRKLKRLAVLTNVIVLLAALLVGQTMFRTLILWGSVIQVVMILPITYKILRRRCKNYEQYEKEF